MNEIPDESFQGIVGIPNGVTATGICVPENTLVITEKYCHYSLFEEVIITLSNIWVVTFALLVRIGN